MQRWSDLDLRRQRLRLEGFDYSNPHHIFFLTVCARYLGKPFSDPRLAEPVNESVLFMSRRNDWHLYAYCLMPDHLHLALSPTPGKDSVPRLLQRFKSYTTRLAWRNGSQGALWQRSYYDHVARQEEDVTTMCDYILANPVRKGLATDATLWPYSGMPHPFPV